MLAKNFKIGDTFKHITGENIEVVEIDGVKYVYVNIDLKRQLWFKYGMANTLLKQMKDIKSEAESLLDYSKEDLNFYIDKIREIDNKIFQVRDIIDGKQKRTKRFNNE